MVMLTQVDRRSGVAYTLEIEPEDIPIRGNAMASGDPAVDRKAEDWIRRQLNTGNQWAWCQVKVTASKGEHQGCDYLGACSYKDTKGFLKGCYWRDMKHEALED